ncbi:hypothetical protein HDU76_012768 [Blyttiomyces sp. JEL0837]|nr:hypothetical protein HDU76_012768 [Blyttiomyces sp. JEL0837]
MALSNAPAAAGAPVTHKFSRSYCYVCGQRGHLSNQCEKTTPVCYNCKEAGHNSRDCPEPRAPKACFRCQSTEHLSKDCPMKVTAQAADRAQATCFRCGVKGHFARECTQKPVNPVGNAGGVGPRSHHNNHHGQNHMMNGGMMNGGHMGPRGPMHHGGMGGHRGGHMQMNGQVQGGNRGAAHVICRRCGIMGHFARQCPQNRQPPHMGMQQNMMPYRQMHNGGRPMHMGAPGPYNQHGVGAPMICLRCGVAGHIAKFCSNPQVCWFCKKTGHVSKDCPQARRCYSCGELGHQARDCQNKPANQTPAPAETEEANE